MYACNMHVHMYPLCVQICFLYFERLRVHACHSGAHEEAKRSRPVPLSTAKGRVGGDVFFERLSVSWCVWCV